MKRLLISIAFIASCLAGFSQSKADSLCWKSAQWEWTDVGGGAVVGYASMRLFDSDQSISVLKYPGRKFKTFLVNAPGRLSGTADSLAIRNHARFAINGSYFNMETRVPQTFFTLRRRLIATSPDKEEYRSNGVFIQRDRRGRHLDIVQYDKRMTDRIRRKNYGALASGPVLLLNGVIPDFDMERSFYHVRHPRSIIGWDNEGYVYMAVVDGRFPGNADGANIPELAIIARLLGMTTALNLDGGGSSTLWTDSTGVVNHPYGNRVFDHGGCRVIPNIIGVK